MYDLIIVGAGITAATFVASLRDRYKICVIECRNHIGGNCHDYQSNGSYIHSYGPHIFHTPAPQITQFLSQFTEWTNCDYTVTAEIENNNQITAVPFPYSKLTADALGRKLSSQEILEMFFHPYSIKMWGKQWAELPQSIRNRVPKDTDEIPSYYPEQFVGLPKFGYTKMITKMLEGADIVLGATTDLWREIPTHKVIYTGRLDLIGTDENPRISFGERYNSFMDYRTLRIRTTSKAWAYSTTALNHCNLRTKDTREVCYRKLTGGASDLVSVESPYNAHTLDTSPYYPYPSNENIVRHQELKKLVVAAYPNLIPAGRLGTYMYLDIFQAVGQALSLVRKHFNGT